MNLLIAESGGTKTDWVITGSREGKRFLQTRGLSPSLTRWERIEEILLHEVKPWLMGHMPFRTYFFGAGLGRQEYRKRMRSLLAGILGFEEQVFVETDLLGGAYACLGSSNGVVGIMGTGSVAFRFHNHKVNERRGGWGYLLGDEGSGSSLGKRLLRGFADGKLPPHLCEAYVHWSGQSSEEVMRAVYNDPVPCLYLARQVPFIAKHIQLIAMQDLVKTEVELYLDAYLLPLVGKETRVMLMGGIAQTFQDIVKSACRGMGMDQVQILTEPPIMPITRFLEEQSSEKQL